MFDLTDTAVETAIGRLRGVARRTPILESPVLNAQLGGRMLIKAESLQHTGSFKFRGAFNAVSQLAKDIPGGAIVAASSGNHASAIAAAASHFGLSATVVIPEDAPAKKVDLINAFGARIVHYNKLTDNRDAIALSEAEAQSASVVNSSDDADVIAGQATVGFELIEQVEELDASIDTLFVPCGGGGLAAGCVWAFSQRRPETKIRTVEPVGFDDMARSILRGERVRIEIAEPSICDGLLHTTPSALPFSILLGRAGAGLSISDAQTVDAMITAFEHLNLVLEPNGAIALAAAIAQNETWKGKTVAVVASGGNVDRGYFQRVLGAGA
jgi:threonine dehydratase